MITTSCRAPVISSLKRIWIGCWKPNVTPGMCCSSFACIFSASSSLSFALVHSFLSLRIMIKSQASTGMGSVGISDEPIFPITSFTSGKFAFKTLAPRVAASMVCERLLPVKTLVSTAKSPSSKVGINSAPSELKINTEAIKRPNATLMISCFDRSAKLSQGV